MCVILVKKSGIKMPSREDLKKCFTSNPDGAGYMLPYKGNVIIRKGFMDYKSFEKDLIDFVKTNKIDPVKTPIICHFRISTQGGVQKGLCHPYPICDDYENMRKLNNTCDIGMAHNGIISVTTDYTGGYCYYNSKKNKWSKPKISYNDTMTFIRDYANLIIDNDVDFAKKPNKIKLMQNVIKSTNKLAFVNKYGVVTTIGDFKEKNGVLYSNLFWDSGRELPFKSAGTVVKSLGMYDFGDNDPYGYDY